MSAQYIVRMHSGRYVSNTVSIGVTRNSGKATKWNFGVAKSIANEYGGDVINVITREVEFSAKSPKFKAGVHVAIKLPA